VGVDLGITNFAALAYEDGHSELYPLNCLKQDDYYFSKRIARCDDSNSEQATRLNHRNRSVAPTTSTRSQKHIVERCVEDGIGTIVIGDLSDIREGKRATSRETGKNTATSISTLWAFDRFTKLLNYKAEMEGISVEKVSNATHPSHVHVVGVHATQTVNGTRVVRV